MNLIFKLLIGLLFSFIGAIAADWLNVPLPWTLGPLLIIALLRLCSVPISSSPFLRNMGQWIIGLTLGLYFTPNVVSVISSYWFSMALGLCFALLLGLYGTFLLHRFGKVDVKTAWFSTAIGGANEMAVLAERYGVRADLVASAHTIRVVLVVLLVPFACEVFKISGLENNLIVQRSFSTVGLLELAVLTFLGGLAAQFLRLSNAWVLGPMFVAMALTMSEVHLSTVPSEISQAAQLLIGWALGDKFRPGFFKAAPRFLSGVVFFSLSSLIFAFVFALFLVDMTGLPLNTLAVSVAPGGIAEMAITAKVLQLGVPFVTAFQVSRMVGVVLLTGPLYVFVLRKLWPEKSKL